MGTSTPPRVPVPLTTQVLSLESLQHTPNQPFLSGFIKHIIMNAPTPGSHSLSHVSHLRTITWDDHHFQNVLLPYIFHSLAALSKISPQQTWSLSHTPQTPLMSGPVLSPPSSGAPPPHNVALVARAPPSPKSGHTFSIDSGAELHLLDERAAQDLLADQTPSDLRIFGVNAEPATAYTRGVLRVQLETPGGQLLPHEFGIADGVYKIPANLLSVALLIDKGAVVHFETNNCYFQPHSTAPRIPLKRVGGLFQFNVQPMQVGPGDISHSNTAFAFGASGDLPLWHYRFNHVDKHRILRWARHHLVPGLNLTGNLSASCPCPECMQSNMRRRAIHNSRSSLSPASRVGHTVHVDTKCLPNVKSLLGNHYMLFFSDEYSRLIVAFAMQAITETPTHLETLVAEFTRAGHHIVHLISDPGTEFSSAFTAVCNKHNILHKPLPTKDKAYLAENAIGIIFRAARVALRHARLSPILWDLAALNSVYTYNRSPHEHHDGQISPIEFFLGRPQPVHHIRVFGCDAFVHRSLDKKIPGIPTAERWLNMGFSRGSDAHLLLNPETRTFCSSTNVIFYESMEARKAGLRSYDKFSAQLRRGDDVHDLPLQQDDLAFEDLEHLDSVRSMYLNPDAPPSDDPDPQLDVLNSVLPAADPLPVTSHPSQDSTIRRPVRLLPRGRRVELTQADKDFVEAALTHNFVIQYQTNNPKKPGSKSATSWHLYAPATTLREALRLGASRADVRWDYEHGFIRFPGRESLEPGHVFMAQVTTGTHSIVTALPLDDALLEEFSPSNVAAFGYYCFATLLADSIYAGSAPTNAELRRGNHHYQAEFEASRDKELLSWARHHSYELMPLSHVPSHAELLRNNWIHSFKLNAAGQQIKPKSRCVSLGNRQQAWASFNPETIGASVTSVLSFRLLLAYAASQNLLVFGADISTAFLHAPLTEPIYMHLPEGFKLPPQFHSTGLRYVMKVLKALYGLRQSGAEFHHMLTDVLNKAGFFSPVGDPCLYRQDYPDEGIVLVATYVDDLTICATTVALKDKFLTFLRQHFEIGDSEGGPIDYMLGISVVQDIVAGTIRLSMAPTIVKLGSRFLTEHERLELSSVTTPMATSGVDKHDGPPVPDTQFPVREALGCLLHIVNWVRVDGLNAVGMLAKIASNPGPQHVQQIKRVIAYLLNTKDISICYNRAASHAQPLVLMFADASYGSSFDHKSRLGGLGMFAGGPITAMSITSPTLDTSSCEAELHAGYLVAKESVYISQLMFDFKMTPKLELLTVAEDNLPVISQTENGIKTIRTVKHVLIRARYLQELILHKRIRLIYVDTANQLADLFTKPLAPEPFIYLRNQILHC